MVSGSLIIVPDARAPCKTIRPSGVMVSGSLIIVPDCPFRVGTCCGRPVVEQRQDASVPLAELIESAKRLLSVVKVRAEVLKTCPACPMAEGFRCRKTPPTPHWDRDLCELWVGQFMVLSYDREAPNQHAVLDLYEDEHWSHKIKNPLGGNWQTGQYQRRLKNTLKEINGRPGLPLVHFSGHANERKIGWKYTMPAK